MLTTTLSQGADYTPDPKEKNKNTHTHTHKARLQAPEEFSIFLWTKTPNTAIPQRPSTENEVFNPNDNYSCSEYRKQTLLLCTLAPSGMASDTSHIPQDNISK